MANTYEISSGDRTKLAVKINSTQTTGIKFAPMDINGATTRIANTGPFIAEIIEEQDNTTKREWIYVVSGTFDDDNNFVCSGTGLQRDVSRTAATPTGSGTGQAFSKNAEVRIVDSHLLLNGKANKDRANTFTADQTIDNTYSLKFGGSSAYIKTIDSGTNILFKDASTSETSLSALAAAAGTDTKVRISANDTTSGFANGKLVAGTGITLTENNDGGNETLTISETGPVTIARGGTAATSFTAFAPLFGGTTATGALQSGAVGTIGHVLTSNGAGAIATYQALPAASYFERVELCSGTASGVLTNPTSATAYDTYTYTVPANFLTGSTALEFDLKGNIEKGASSTFVLGIYLGATEIVSGTFTADANNLQFRVHGSINGTAAAGASVAVVGNINGEMGTITGGTYKAFTHTTLPTQPTVATNGTLAFTLKATFGTSNGGNTTTLRSGKITRIATTPF